MSAFTTGNEAAPYYHQPTNQKSETHKTQALISQLRQITAVLERVAVTCCDQAFLFFRNTHKKKIRKEEGMPDRKLEVVANTIT